jgi:hypothetical protein
MVCHTLTYFLMGALAAHFLNYADVMARPDSGMRQMTEPWVMAGPLFQPLRGLVFALVFYPLRECLFGRKNGWLLMSWILIALGILSTFGPASGSILRHDLHSCADSLSAQRLGGSGAAGRSVIRAAVLLGKSPGEEVAELAARNPLFHRDGPAGPRPAGAQAIA